MYLSVKLLQCIYTLSHYFTLGGIVYSMTSPLGVYCLFGGMPRESATMYAYTVDLYTYILIYNVVIMFILG